MVETVKERKLKPQFILMALEKELKEHDWTFQYSDDHGYWSNGISEQKRMTTHRMKKIEMYQKIIQIKLLMTNLEQIK